MAIVSRALDGSSATDDTGYALAVSGGPDSMAMLALAHAAFPGRIAAATFDHRLRDGSAGEAAMVAAACATLGIPHATLVPDKPIAGASLQRQAREARYAALVAWAAGRPLLTAHHADDQAETLLMRLNRASGLAGLAGIRAVRWAGGTPILRPLLDWRREELRVIAEGSGLGFVDDPSNTDVRHDRTRIRASLIATPTLDPAALAASAAFLGDAEEALRYHADILWSDRWHGPDRGMDVADLPREMRRRLLRRALIESRRSLAIVLPPFSEASNVEPLLDALARGVGAVQGGVKVTPLPTGWTFRAAPPRRSH
ncbi:hypothetical protein ASG29_11210 [Sphingomonas sp. Leaf412]|nr:hypothetical protein ASG29_11210 [Sphingomonas sp. Leaf412]